MDDSADDTDLANPKEGLLAPLIEAHAPVSPSTSVSALALNFALKYHDVTIIKDGVMYQQLRMEGRNIHDLQFHEVLETATKFEAWILAGEMRHAEMLRSGVTQQFVGLLKDIFSDAVEQMDDEEEKEQSE